MPKWYYVQYTLSSGRLVQASCVFVFSHVLKLFENSFHYISEGGNFELYLNCTVLFSLACLN